MGTRVDRTGSHSTRLFGQGPVKPATHPATVTYGTTTVHRRRVGDVDVIGVVALRPLNAQTYQGSWGLLERARAGRLEALGVGLEGSLFVGAQGALTVGASGGSVSLDGYGFVGARLEGRASRDVVIGEGALAVRAEAGVEGQALAQVSLTQVKTDLEGFVGGRLEGELSVANQFGAVAAEGALTAGLGAELELQAGLEGGVLRLEYELGLTVGLGLEVGGRLDIDAKAIGGAVYEQGKALAEELLETPTGQALKREVDEVTHELGEAYERLESYAAPALEAVSDWFE